MSNDPKSKQNDRAQKRAAALRENLQKRKALKTVQKQDKSKEKESQE